MNIPLFIETIKVKDGIFYNLPLHQTRLLRTVNTFFGTHLQLSLSTDMIPEHLQQGLVKCRILYSKDILSIEFEPYSFKEIKSLTIVENNEVTYPYKSADRAFLIKLYSQKGKGSDILIVKNDLVTDTSYTNIVFESSSRLFTPCTYLLAGTKRQQLLQQGIITEKEIRLEDISSFSKIYLINSMIDLQDEICIDISSIQFN